MCADAEQSGCDRAVSQWLAFTVSAAASGCDTASHTSLFSHKTINICSVITNELSVSEKMVISILLQLRTVNFKLHFQSPVLIKQTCVCVHELSNSI